MKYENPILLCRYTLLFN